MFCNLGCQDNDAGWWWWCNQNLHEQENSKIEADVRLQDTCDSFNIVERNIHGISTLLHTHSKLLSIISYHYSAYFIIIRYPCLLMKCIFIVINAMDNSTWPSNINHLFSLLVIPIFACSSIVGDINALERRSSYSF